jgi:hypothetical protein
MWMTSSDSFSLTSSTSPSLAERSSTVIPSAVIPSSSAEYDLSILIRQGLKKLALSAYLNRLNPLLMLTSPTPFFAYDPFTDFTFLLGDSP